MKKKIIAASIAFLLIAGVGGFAAKQFAFAQTATELQEQINNHSSTIQQLEEEIKQYQAELGKTSAEAKTLQNTVQTLDINSKRLSTDIKLTETKIEKTNLSIQQLGLDITDKQKKINKDVVVIGQMIAALDESDDLSLLEILLSYPDISTFLTQVETINQLQTNVRKHLDELRELKEELTVNKTATEQKKSELEGLKGQLGEQKTSVEINKQAKATLLSETKSKESSYKQLIADKVAKKKAFEQELSQYESQLKRIIDPKSIPTAKSGVLAWPTSSQKVTQYFGHTEFSKTVSVYNGSGHNGIDIGIPIGTPIKSAASGVVKGTGNTDSACSGASYGMWVLVEHTNGLSTLYGHLSQIKVSSGQQVAEGDLLGYSGMTGYATGPHLHFTVFASGGVAIQSMPSSSCKGAIYTLPRVTEQGATLNPMNYL